MNCSCNCVACRCQSCTACVFISLLRCWINMKSRFLCMSLACLMLELRPLQTFVFSAAEISHTKSVWLQVCLSATYGCAYWPSKRLTYNSVVNGCFLSVQVRARGLCAHGVCPCVCSMRQRVEWQINRKQMNSDQYEAREWRREKERLKVSEWGDAPERRRRRRGGGCWWVGGVMCYQQHSD